MNPTAALKWWPANTLCGHPIREVFVCGHQLHPPPYSHIVNLPRLEIPLSGRYENQIEIGGQITTVCLRPGTALFAAPNCWNLPVWRHKMKMMSILFGKKQIGVSIVSTQGSRAPGLAAEKHSTLWPLTGPLPHIVSAMVELCMEGRPQGALPGLAHSLMLCLHELFERPAGRSLNRAQGLFESAYLYLQNHYQNDITRDSVAQQFEVTPNHLSRLFKTHGHMTFHDYLTHVRIDRAKYLLKSYNLKIDAIASRCGYHNAPYFHRVFKKMTKTTPAEYRATVLHKHSENG